MEAAILCATAEDPQMTAHELSSALRWMLLGMAPPAVFAGDRIDGD
jgi:hypothetical protein